jgi:N-acetylmuramoyl-L-alanine amidase
VAAATVGSGLHTYLVGDTEYYSLWEFAKRYSPTGRWRIENQTVTITGEKNWLQLRMESREAIVNGMHVWLTAAATSLEGRVMISQEDALDVLLPLWTASPSVPSTVKAKRIVLDPGHGGEDHGTRGRSGVKEKTLTLDLALRIERLLAREGYEVILTRRWDTFISLEQRAEVANNRRADLFLSLHLNSAPDSSVDGIETYCLPVAGKPSTAGYLSRGDRTRRYPGNANDRANLMLAYSIHRAVVTSTGSADRGVRRARFSVLRDTTCPAALLELGFLSNRSDEERLRTESYRDQLAQAVTRGVLNYLDAKERNASQRSKLAKR